MEKLGRYKLTTSLSNKNAGSCQWCFATRDGREYFIKEFLEPKYPENDITSSPEKRTKKIQKCRMFEARKTQVYRQINEASDGNAVRVEEFFRVNSKYYMAMPKIQAVNLTVEEIAGLPEYDKRRVCAIIAHALSGLHTIRFVHADIKHTNVLLTMSPQKALTAKLIDYDAGFFEHDPPKNPEEIHGDQVYYSPEALRAIYGEEIELTCKLDMFALGVLFHQYFTGELPEFEEQQFCCVGEAVAMGATVGISLDIPEDVRNLIIRMLALNPDERPTALQVFQVLSRVKKVSYQVHHETDGHTREVFEFHRRWERCPNGRIEVEAASVWPVHYEGYRFVGMFPDVKPGQKVEDGTVITLKYAKCEAAFVGDPLAQEGFQRMGDL